MSARRVTGRALILLALAAAAVGTAVQTHAGLIHDGRDDAYDGLWLWVHLLSPLAGLVAGGISARLRRSTVARTVSTTSLAGAAAGLISLVAMFATAANTACVNELDPGNQECGIATLFITVFAAIEIGVLAVVGALFWAFAVRRRSVPRPVEAGGERGNVPA
jgi:hypothetical protein